MNNTILPEERLLQLIKNNNPFGANASCRMSDSRRLTSNYEKLISKVLIFFLFVSSAFAIKMFYPLTSDKIKIQTVKQQSPDNTRQLKNAVTQTFNDIPQISNFYLIGVIGGNSPSAIIEDRTSGHNYNLEIGNTFSGYTVKKIEKGRLILWSDNKEFVLTM